MLGWDVTAASQGRWLLAGDNETWISTKSVTPNLLETLPKNEMPKSSYLIIYFLFFFLCMLRDLRFAVGMNN